MRVYTNRYLHTIRGTDPKGSQTYTKQLGGGDGGPVKRDSAFWQAVQAVIARGAMLRGEGLVGYSLLTLSRGLTQIKLLAPESPLLCPKTVAYEVIDNFFLFND
jgi:hypothetical protein